MVKIIAPAGSLEMGGAVIKEGADAVFFGPKRWSRRAPCFELEDTKIKALIQTAHDHNVSAHCAMNINLTEERLGEFSQDIRKYADMGADAFILGDAGAIKYASSELQGIPIHASVMCNVMNWHQARFYGKIGAASIILPHLTIDESKEIKKKSKMGIELFPWGYDNYTIRGACLMSSYFSRGFDKEVDAGSFNRIGVCQRVCRNNWSAHVSGKIIPNFRLDSPPFCIVNELPKYISIMGKDDFIKIQGREWTPSVVTRMVRLIREIVDTCDENGADTITEDQKKCALDLDRERQMQMVKRTDEIHETFRKKENTKPAQRGHIVTFDAKKNATPIDIKLAVSIPTLDVLKKTDLGNYDSVLLGNYACNRFEGNLLENLEELKEAVLLLKRKGKEAYITTPVSLRGDTVRRTEELLRFCSENGVTGIEVHNQGILDILEENNLIFGDIIAGSFLNVYNQYGASALMSNGVTRIMPTGELSLKEIESIKDAGFNMELQVHGKIPVGVCEACPLEQNSKILGAGCPNACKKNIEFEHEGKSLRSLGKLTLSGQDLCMIDHLPYLLSRGFRAFRINGLSETPLYLSTIGKIYKDALTKNNSATHIKELADLSARGLCNGFYFGTAGSEFITRDGTVK